jgi:DNA-binding response OmpR family regulator
MLIMDIEAHRVLVDGDEVDLSLKEFRVLQIFIERPGKLVPRRDIAVRVWDREDGGKTLDVHMSTLRRKLGDRVAIRTIRRVGYRLDTPAAFARSDGSEVA